MGNGNILNAKHIFRTKLLKKLHCTTTFAKLSEISHNGKCDEGKSTGRPQTDQNVVDKVEELVAENPHSSTCRRHMSA
jgi:hypothetical protein